MDSNEQLIDPRLHQLIMINNYVNILHIFKINILNEIMISISHISQYLNHYMLYRQNAIIKYIYKYYEEHIFINNFHISGNIIMLNKLQDILNINFRKHTLKTPLEYCTYIIFVVVFLYDIYEYIGDHIFKKLKQRIDFSKIREIIDNSKTYKEYLLFLKSYIDRIESEQLISSSVDKNNNYTDISLNKIIVYAYNNSFNYLISNNQYKDLINLWIRSMSNTYYIYIDQFLNLFYRDRSLQSMIICNGNVEKSDSNEKVDKLLLFEYIIKKYNSKLNILNNNI